jgi:hypothetical protein
MHQFWLIIVRTVEIELGLREYPAALAVDHAVGTQSGARPYPLFLISRDLDFVWDVWLVVVLDFEAQPTPRQTVPHSRETLCKYERLAETVRTAKLDRCRRSAHCSAIDST